MPERAELAERPAAVAASARARRPRGELIAWGVLVALALALRFYDLGARPFHHDESQDAYFSWVFQTDGDYKYDPLLHGPLRFYLTAAMYTLFGDSDFTARLAPALMGTSMVALPYRCAASSAASPRSPPPCCWPSARRSCTSRASPARTSTSPRSRWRCSSSPSASSTRPRR